jgi:DNA-binding Lrp family transcriptional regulator
MNEEQMKSIIGGIFGTGKYTVFTDEGEAVEKKEKFNIRLYKDLWYSGAIKKLKGNKLSVWLTIAIHANNSAEGWPSQRTIAELLGLNKDTVTKTLEALEKDGFIERSELARNDNGRFKNTKYKIKFAPDLTSPKKPDREEPSKNKDSIQSEKTVHGKTGHGKVGHKKESLKEDLVIKKDIDDDATPISNIWDEDDQYKTFREKFTQAGSSDIAKHEDHYPKFKGAISKIGFDQLVLSAEKYIAKKGNKSQIVYFLKDHYNQYIEVDKPPVSKKKATPISKMPKSIQKQMDAKQSGQAQIAQAQAETAVTIDPETRDDIEATIALLRSMENQGIGQ